jgi:anaerobic selenocysteine-containing dehydrogenase
MSMSTERSQSSQWAKLPEGPAVLTVHPEAAPGFAEGEVVRLESRAGSLAVRLKLDARQRRDVAILPKGGHLHRGQAANALIRARTTDLGEGAALHDERVRLVKA